MFFFGRKKRNVANFIEKNEQINLSKVISEAEKKEQELNKPSFEFQLLKSKKVIRASVNDLLEKSGKEVLKPVSSSNAIYLLKDNSLEKKVSDFYTDDKKEKRPLTREEKREIIERRRYIMNLEKHSYAGFFIRFLSYIIDCLIVSAILTFIPKKDVIDFLNAERFFDTISLFTITFVIYSLLTNLIFKGQSIGKIITNIKVVRDGKEDIDYFTIFIRETVGRIFMLYFSFLGIFIPFSKKRHHLMDYLLDTSVIRLKYAEDYKVLLTINA